MRSLATLLVIGSLCGPQTLTIEPKEVDEGFLRPRVEIADLGPEHNGKEVVMRFKVKNANWTWNPDPLTPGQARPLWITPVVPEGSPPLSVMVSGDLADLMRRFRLGEGSEAIKGIEVQAAGTIAVFPAPKDGPAKERSFQFRIHDWKLFRVMKTNAPSDRKRETNTNR